MDLITTESSEVTEKEEAEKEEAKKEKTDTLTGEIIGASIDIHRALGPGLLESDSRGATVVLPKIVELHSRSFDQFQRKISQRRNSTYDVLILSLCPHLSPW